MILAICRKLTPSFVGIRRRRRRSGSEGNVEVYACYSNAVRPRLWFEVAAGPVSNILAMLFLGCDVKGISADDGDSESQAKSSDSIADSGPVALASQPGLGLDLRERPAHATN